MNNRKILCHHAIQLYQGKINELDEGVLNSKDFLDFCAKHRILSRMEKKISPYLKNESIKKYFYAQLQTIRLESLKQITTFNIIAKLFNQNNITWLSFKGPVLSQTLFGDATTRSSNDIDIWVEKSDFFKAHNLLTQHGFLLSRFSEKSRKKFYHFLIRKDDSYLHQPTGVMLELHWNLINGSGFTKKAISENKKDIKFLGSETPVLSSEMEFIYLCAHASAAHAKRLCWLFDLYDYRQKVSLKDTELFKLAKKHDLDRYLHNGLDLMNHFFHGLQQHPSKKGTILRLITKKQIKMITNGKIKTKNSFSFLMILLFDEAFLAKSFRVAGVNFCTFLASTIKNFKL